MEGLTLLREAREAGLKIAVVGDSLEIVGPKAAAPIVERIRQHKPEVLAALRDGCCPACDRRRNGCAIGPPLDISDGCELHHVTPEQTAHWWSVAQDKDATVSVCHCCGGPAPNEALVCRRCEEEPDA
jgi:ribosomal protein L40E